MIAFQALLITVMIVGAIFIFLTLLIMGNKATRDLWAFYCRRRRRTLEPAILKYVNSESGDVGKYLSGLLRPFDSTIVEKILVDNAHVVKGTAKERITKAFEDLGYVDSYLKGLKSVRWWKRAQSAENLGVAESRRAIDPLAKLIADPVPEVRVRSAKALGNMKGIAAAKPLVQALAEPNRWSTIRIADILSSMGKEVVDELMQCFRECPIHAKIAAIDILGRIKSLHTVSFLVERLSDQNSDIRARAAHALGAIGDPSCYKELIVALEDKEWPVRAMAAKALGKIKVPEAIQPLCKILGDSQWWVRANTAEALKSMGDRGVEALFEMIDSRDNYASHQAVLMLQESGIMDEYLDKLSSKDDAVKKVALELFAKLVRMKRTDLLEEAAHKHSNPAVRQILSDLLVSNLQKA
ncbi:MAG: HEAT repeat domain-containing protein [Acidobacteriota bacterium]